MGHLKKELSVLLYAAIVIRDQGRPNSLLQFNGIEPGSLDNRNACTVQTEIKIVI